MTATVRWLFGNALWCVHLVLTFCTRCLRQYQHACVHTVSAFTCSWYCALYGLPSGHAVMGAIGELRACSKSAQLLLSVLSTAAYGMQLLIVKAVFATFDAVLPVNSD